MDNFSDIVGNRQSNNIDLLIKHLLGLNECVLPFYDQGKPYLKGDFDFQYYDYLKNKELNNKPLSANKVFEDISSLFQNIPNWANPGTMLNIIPNVNIAALAAATYASLYNANFSQDRYSGLLLAAELEVVKYISDIAGWNWRKSHGIFTFGGKGTNLYATKIALNRACLECKQQGLYGNQFFLVTSRKGHPCHKEVAEWVGIGSNNCLAIDCDDKGEMILDKAKDLICSNIEQGKIFVGFNLTGGSTVEFEIDPIKEIALLRDEIVKKYKLKYSPLIHVDSVIVWIWLFFKEYDFIKNPLDIKEPVLHKVEYLTQRISEIKYADSFGVDFHKSGFCPAISSLYMVKDRTDIYQLGNTTPLQIEDLKFGNFSPFESSLELSRSSWGPVSALVSLRTFGIEGFQKAIVHMMSCSEFFKKELQNIECIEVINPDTNGFATLLIFKPKEFVSLSLAEILVLPFEDTERIKNYNINYASYVIELNRQHKISFTLTASDAFNVKNTNVCLGSQKAYPMSLFVSKDDVKQIIKEMMETKKNFDEGGGRNYSRLDNSPVDMVYRK